MGLNRQNDDHRLFRRCSAEPLERVRRDALQSSVESTGPSLAEGLWNPRGIGYFASCAARYPSASFFSSSGVSFGDSIETVSLLILPLNANGI